MGLFDGLFGEKDSPEIPKWALSDWASGLRTSLVDKSNQFLGKGYQDWYNRFDIPESRIGSDALIKFQHNVLDHPDYDSMNYDDYLSRFTIPDSSMKSKALSMQEGLLSGDYGIDDYSDVENKYLDMVTKNYKSAREEEFNPIRESLIAEGLFGSGPGFELMKDYAGETAEGVGDISTRWAYDAIERYNNQKMYQDSLKRGDISTAYNLALNEQNQELAARTSATDYANAEKQYYDALMRGDLETAFNISQTLRSNEMGTRDKATSLEFQGLDPAMSMYSSGVTEADKKYASDMAEWEVGYQETAAKNAKRNQLANMAGGLALGALTGGIGGAMGAYGAGVGALKGAGYGAIGYSPSMAMQNQNIGSLFTSGGSNDAMSKLMMLKMMGGM